MSMSRVATLLSIIVAVAALATGCSTTKQTEDLLSEAGFKIVPAVTPRRQAHVKSLPEGKITKVQREGKTYFVYPDVARNVIYVGRDAQYQRYQKLGAQSQLALEQSTDEKLNSGPGWGVWGGPWE
jgi:hypothetical protein